MGVITANATDANPFRRKSINKTCEFDRIFAIPRRVWTDEDADKLRFELSDILRRDGGEQTLRRIQAVSLNELGVEGGIISTATMGAGKTLIGLLSSYIVEAERTLWLVPADLEDKTKRDRDFYAKHWHGIPALHTGAACGYFMRVITYDLMGGKNHADLIHRIRPKLIICDEAHRLKNTGAAVTKRLKRWMKEFPNTPLVLMSGTMMAQSLKEMWHLLRWTLPPENVPLPSSYTELDNWAQCIDNKIKDFKRVKPGAFLLHATEEEKKIAIDDPKKVARMVFQRRFVETPGIVSTKNTYEGAELKIRALEVDPPENVKKNILWLKKKWKTEDGWTCADAGRVAGHVREYAQGYYLIWDPRPKEE